MNQCIATTTTSTAIVHECNECKAREQDMIEVNQIWQGAVRQVFLCDACHYEIYRDFWSFVPVTLETNILVQKATGYSSPV